MWRGKRNGLDIDAGVPQGPVSRRCSPKRSWRHRVRRRSSSTGRVSRKLLDSGDKAQLTLVAAPAGYGKTTAVRGLVRESRSACLPGSPSTRATTTRSACGRTSQRPSTVSEQGSGAPPCDGSVLSGGAIDAPIDELMNGLDATAARPGHRARRPADRHGRRVSGVDRIRARAHAPSRTPDRDLARRPGAQACEATGGGRAGRAAGRRPRVHEGRGAPARRRRRSASTSGWRRCGRCTSGPKGGPPRSCSPRSGFGPWTTLVGPCASSAAVTASSPTT